MIAIASVVAVTKTANGSVLITVVCPHKGCRARHRHRWLSWPDPPGLRMSHCASKRTPYEIGAAPADRLLSVAADLRRASRVLHRTPWASFTPDDVTAVSAAARLFADAVEQAKQRQR